MSLKAINPSARSFLAVAILAVSLTVAPVDPKVASTPSFVDPAIARQAADRVSVIVQKWPGSGSKTEASVAAIGGKVVQDLPLLQAFAAEVPRKADLGKIQGARAITLNTKIAFQSSTASTDSVSSVYPKSLRATKMWSAGYTGKGVTVAIIDTGITEVGDLSGRVLPVYDDVKGTWAPCLNLSGENHCSDSFGHGTFVAGVVAGDGTLSGGKWKGVAPGANLVSIKIAGRSGSADVSSILAGIQWAVSFKTRYNIRVLNLSLGTNGTGSYTTDPLNYAVQKAWDAGIAVVVSASNHGPDPQTITKPADDPWVITVGAVDDRETAGIGDDALPNFTSRGPTKTDGMPKPDVVAPGAHIVSLRSPGSAVDEEFPFYVDSHYRKGSGTSMSAAAVSGVAALMVQANPQMTPNRLKFALMSTARKVASDDPMAVGRGMPEAYEASFNAPAGLANQGLSRSSGLGPLDASRGDVRVAANDPFQTVVTGQMTGQLLTWNALSYTTSTWDGSGWYGSGWYGSGWYGSGWYGSGWYGSGWYGSGWYGQPTGSGWYGSGWYGSGWYGAWE